MSSSDPDTDAAMEVFGYEPVEGLTRVTSFQVAEAKDGDTLEPVVVLWMRLEDDGSRFGVSMAVELVDALAAELVSMAALARAKHWAPT